MLEPTSPSSSTLLPHTDLSLSGRGTNQRRRGGRRRKRHTMDTGGFFSGARTPLPQARTRHPCPLQHTGGRVLYPRPSALYSTPPTRRLHALPKSSRSRPELPPPTHAICATRSSARRALHPRPLHRQTHAHILVLHTHAHTHLRHGTGRARHTRCAPIHAPGVPNTDAATYSPNNLNAPTGDRQSWKSLWDLKNGG